MPLPDHFDLLAPLYDRLIRVDSEPSLGLHLNLPTEGWLLDAAGGTGRMAERLAGSVGGVIVLDASTPMLRQALSKGCCLAVAGTTERLPVANGSLARITLVDAYHHLADQERSLAELWRTLAPGGRLVIEEPDIRRLAVRIVALIEKLALMRSHFASGDRMAADLRRLGAQVEVRAENHTLYVVADKPAA
jgi:demethylmenaquinone methyltransferase/2-methoxy-6-polyprenyl-1,4-benzoquinol methylase